MDDLAGRILAVESALIDVQRSLTAHDLLLRGLLTHLAVSDPGGFQGLVEGFSKSGFFGQQRLSGELTAQVAQILTEMFDEVTRGVEARRQV